MQALKEIEEGLIFLVKTDNKNFLEKTVDTLKKLINQDKLLCIYITFNKPAKLLEKIFKSKEINTNKILFIDAISRLSEDVDMEPNFVYVNSPKELTDLLMIIRNYLEMNRDTKKKFILIDSLSNISIYNSNEETIKFVQSLTNKLRLIEVGGELMVVEGGLTKEVTVQEFRKYVDQVVQL